MGQQQLYRHLAQYYDLLYSRKNYSQEAHRITRLISRHKNSEGNELLDVGCGTGGHLRHLKNRFSCMGVDLHDRMLRIARMENGGIVFKKADMIRLDLKKQFDAILCLYSAIAYVRTYSNLRKTILNFSKHLKPGGILLIDPWFTPSRYKVGFVHSSTVKRKNTVIAQMHVQKTKGSTAVRIIHYLIAEKDKGVRHFTSRHEMGLFEIGKTLELMRSAGLRSKFLKRGLLKNRGLFLGIKI